MTCNVKSFVENILPFIDVAMISSGGKYRNHTEDSHAKSNEIALQVVIVICKVDNNSPFKHEKEEDYAMRKFQNLSSLVLQHLMAISSEKYKHISQALFASSVHIIPSSIHTSALLSASLKIRELTQLAQLSRLTQLKHVDAKNQSIQNRCSADISLCIQQFCCSVIKLVSRMSIMDCLLAEFSCTNNERSYEQERIKITSKTTQSTNACACDVFILGRDAGTLEEQVLTNTVDAVQEALTFAMNATKKANLTELIVDDTSGDFHFVSTSFGGVCHVVPLIKNVFVVVFTRPYSPSAVPSNSFLSSLEKLNADNDHGNCNTQFISNIESKHNNMNAKQDINESQHSVLADDTLNSSNGHCQETVELTSNKSAISMSNVMSHIHSLSVADLISIQKELKQVIDSEKQTLCKQLNIKI
jgi:hypothetical protein